MTSTGIQQDSSAPATARGEAVTLSLHAMATRFEMVLYGESPVRLRAAGEEALGEIARLDAQLSFYSPASEISQINRRAADAPVKVDPRLFRLLADCARLSRLTRGAFDITVGPLVKTWRTALDSGRLPEIADVVLARECAGMQHVELDEEEFTVRFKRSGVQLDLGAYAKGYAIDRAIDLLREAGITSALVHGGTSSVCSIGAPPGQESWRVALNDPFRKGDDVPVIELVDSALSVSAIHGRSHHVDGRDYGHVIDPRTGQPVDNVKAAAVTGPLPTWCEALSTALL